LNADRASSVIVSIEAFSTSPVPLMPIFMASSLFVLFC
jgi:hypothetical protein